MKYKILKALDIAGLKVLDPVVRLAYREEPREQVRKIILFIAIPIVTFCAFLVAWAYIAPRHTTKSGEVPTPSVVWDSAKNIWVFHQRENIKEEDFRVEGAEREKRIAEVTALLEKLKPELEKADAQLNAAQQQAKAATDQAVAPLMAVFEKTKDQFKQAESDRKKELNELAKTIKDGDTAARAEYLKKVEAHIKQSDVETQQLQVIKARIDVVMNQKHEGLIAARLAKNRVAEQVQFLSKRLENLGDNNQQQKVLAAQKSLEEKKEKFSQASGRALYFGAMNIHRAEDRLGRIETSTYAKPWTFPAQIVRSLGCVFLGFVIATIIAVPIGILCGLSPVFMAAMTPLISLFKPVSPIVWLPIVFIIVGGFIDDPEQAPVHPAFLSSAITVALCSLWPTLVNTALGVAAIDKDHLNVARVLRLGFWNRLFKIIIPSALPLIFAGLRISLGVGWMVLIAAELLSSSEGIGKFVWDMFNNGSSQTFAQMFVVVFVVGIVGLMLDRTMIVFQRLVSFDGAPTAI
ncbi:MAG: ABC transporter permease [Phycisphaeraceae bacterium]|nr:ABC transporter permease [Phycisphaeraceae bacterium]